jgi:hypothetical protein
MNLAKAKFLVVRRHWTQMGEERERERIIKLLEDEQWHDMVIQMTSPPKRAHSYDCIGCKQISLIKGETNG